MNSRFILAGAILILLIAIGAGCSARGTSSGGVTGTTGITGTTGGTTGTGTAAPTTAAPGTPSTPGTSDRIRPRLRERNEEDIWITNKVVEKLEQAGLSGLSNIEVDSDDQIVTLEGTVPSAEEAEQAVNLARSVPTVKDVVSKLQIKQ